MTFQEYHLVCPYCGAFSKFYSMMSCTYPYGSSFGEMELLCTDLHYTNHRFTCEMGSKGMEVPITCCHACHRYFQKKTARQFSAYDSPNKSTSLPVIKSEFNAQEIHEAIVTCAFQGPHQEQELRLLAWVLSNHPERETVSSSLVNLDRYDPYSGTIPIDLADRIRAFRSLISRWVDGVDTYTLESNQRKRSLPENECVLSNINSPDFENEIAELMQVRERARDNLWEKRAIKQETKVEWRIGNLERLIELLTDSQIELNPSTSREHLTSEDHLRIKMHLKKAEALRQLGRFDESLRLLGEPHQIKAKYLGHRHVAKVIHELASQRYSFLWLSIGEEDYTPAELVEIIRKKILDNQEAQRQQQWRQAARERDLAFVRKAIQFQELIDFRGSLNGKTTSQRIEEKLICPNCQFRYLWDGSRCGHCDKSVFEMGRPDDRTISKIRFELTGR